MGNYKLDRFILFNSTSCDTSILTNKISAATTSEYIKKQFPYHSIVHLNQNSIHEVVWWTKNLEISNGKSILSFINKTNNPSRCFSEGLGAYCQKISIGLRILQKSRLH